MILSGQHADGDALQRFLAEAKSVAELHHTNVVQLFDSGTHEGLPYFTLEYVPGGSLQDRLREGPLQPNEAAAIVEQLARGMQHAHDKNIVHRDLKPHNVLMTEDGTPKVTDFGLAKKVDVGGGLTVTGAIMGTPSYMAPEQACGKGKEATAAADVYALGAILYACVTGRPPFQAATPLDTLLQVIADEPVPPSRLVATMPRDVETICLKCLQKEPEKRYASAAALADDLHRFSNGEPITARPVSRAERLVKLVKRNPLPSGLAAAVLFSLVLGAAVSLGFAFQSQKNADAANARSEDYRLENIEAIYQRNRAESALGKEKEATATAKQALGDYQRESQQRLLHIRTAMYLKDYNLAWEHFNNNDIPATRDALILLRYALSG